MPSRWWVPLPDLTSPGARLEHVHAVGSAWFDQCLPEHHAGEKPYALSPVALDARGRPGMEVGTLTDEAEERLLTALSGEPSLRLGHENTRALAPELLTTESWGALARTTGSRAWELHLLSPTTFRSGDRASPLPHLPTILDGLGRTWAAWSDVARSHDPVSGREAYVGDLDLSTDVLRLMIKDRQGNRRAIVVPGCLGVLGVRTATARAAGRVEPLLRLAQYSGIGSMTRRGCGVTRVNAAGRSAAPRTEASKRGRSHGATG